jgi:hypothetical protein
MRTKALLCAAALAAGAATSMAQNVYSLNVVGYINLTLQPGFNLIANQLDADGTMTNNFVTNVIGTTNLINGSAIYSYSVAAGGFGVANLTRGVWKQDVADANAALAPGQGVFVYNNGPTPVTITTVGQVIQGTNTIPLVAGFQIVSSIAPIAGDLVTNLNYTPTAGDTVYYFDPIAQGYTSWQWTSRSGGKWVGSTRPYLNVSDAIFLQPVVNTNWTQTFTVQ